MRRFALVLTLASMSLSSGAAWAADAENGQVLAERWCTGCHVVSGTQNKGTDLAPSFVSIAERPDFNAEKLAFFLLDPHPKMPNMALSRSEAANISAYVASLKRP